MPGSGAEPGLAVRGYELREKIGDGRVRGRLPRLSARRRSRGGDQGHPTGARQRPRLHPSLPGRGAAGRPARAPSHRSALRLLARARCGLPRDAADAGREPGHRPRTPRPEPRRRPPRWSISSAARCRRRTARVSSTATSSRPTSSSTTRATPTCPTSGSPSARTVATSDAPSARSTLDAPYASPEQLDRGEVDGDIRHLQPRCRRRPGAHRAEW